MKNSKKLLLAALATGMLLAQGMMVSAHETAEAPERELPVVNDMSKYNDVANQNFSGQWVYDSNAGKWWFKGNDNTYPVNDIFEANGVAYGFDEAGWMVTGWHYYSQYGSWFYFYGDGSMAKGWVNDGGTWYYTDPEDGFMYYDGIYEIGGSDYFFYPSGAMAANGWAGRNEENYSWWVYATGSGALYKGWLWDNGWYYLGEYAGVMYDSGNYYFEAEDKWYVFEKGGRMANGGWVSCPYSYKYEDGSTLEGVTWYYANSDGTAYNGWLQDGGNWYMINYGYMMENSSFTDGGTGKTYFFQKGGVMATTPGWYAAVYTYSDGMQSVDWYYVKDASGELYADGTYKIGGKDYNFDSLGWCMNP